MPHERAITVERDGRHYVESSVEPGKVLEGPFETPEDAERRSILRSEEYQSTSDIERGGIPGVFNPRVPMSYIKPTPVRPFEARQPTQKQPTDTFDPITESIDVPVRAHTEQGSSTNEQYTYPGVMHRGAGRGITGTAAALGTGLRFVGRRLQEKRPTTKGEAVVKEMEGTTVPGLVAKGAGYVGRHMEDWGVAIEDYWGPKSKEWDTPGLTGAKWLLNATAEAAPAFAISVGPAVMTARMARLMKYAPEAARKLGILAGSAGAGGLEGTGTYRRMLEAGATEPEAARAFVMMSIGSGALNAVSLDKFMKGLPDDILGNLLSRNFKGLVEAATEFAEEPLEAGIMMAHGRISLDQAINDIAEGLYVMGPAYLLAAIMPGAGSVGRKTVGEKKEPTPLRLPKSKGAYLVHITPEGEQITVRPGEQVPERPPIAPQQPEVTAGRASANALNKSRADIAGAAQEVYDEWEQDEEGLDPEGCPGGICHNIADSIAEKLNDKFSGIETTTVDSQGVGEQHVWVVARTDDGIFSIDIPPGVYETGGGYNWRKKPGVVFSGNDVFVDKLSSDPNDWSEYTGIEDSDPWVYDPDETQAEVKIPESAKDLPIPEPGEVREREQEVARLSEEERQLEEDVEGAERRLEQIPFEGGERRVEPFEYAEEAKEPTQDLQAVSVTLSALEPLRERTTKPSDELLQSVRIEGVKRPIQITFDQETNRVVVDDGAHRLSAANIAKLDRVPVKVRMGYVPAEVGIEATDEIRSSLRGEWIRPRKSEREDVKRTSLREREELHSEINDDIDTLNQEELGSLKRERVRNKLRKRLRAAVAYYDEDGGIMHLTIGEQGEAHPDLLGRAPDDLTYTGNSRGFYDVQAKKFMDETELSSLDSLDMFTEEEVQSFAVRHKLLKPEEAEKLKMHRVPLKEVPVTGPLKSSK